MMAKSSRGSRLSASSLVAIGALALLSFVMFEPNGIFGRRIALWKAQRAQVTRIDEAWISLINESARDQPSGASVIVVEAIDYECPFCRTSHSAVREYQARSPEHGFAFLHVPLEHIHPKARIGALYAICAELQGRFSEAHDYLLSASEWADSLPHEVIGNRIGVPSVGLFAQCISGQQASDILARHLQLAEQIGVQATPAIITRKGIEYGSFSTEALARIIAEVE